MIVDIRFGDLFLMMRVITTILALLILISLSGVIIDCMGFIGSVFGTLFGVLLIIGILGLIITRFINR